MIPRLLFLALSTAGIASSRAVSSPQTLLVAHQKNGALTIGFDPSKSSTESLQILGATEAGNRPGWLCAYDDDIYAVSRTHYPRNTSESGGIFAFEKTCGGKSLHSLDDESSNGLGGVHCDVRRGGRMLAAANM